VNTRRVVGSSLLPTLGMALAALVSACATGRPGTTAQSAQVHQQTLAAAGRMIAEGNPSKAIVQYLDPIIEQFESHRVPSGTVRYSANSLSESVFYSVLGVGGEATARSGPARQVVVLDGVWSSALHLKGYALIEAERFDEAKVVLRHGTEVAPMNPLIWNELGAVLQLEEDWPAALHAFEQGAVAAELVFDDASGEVNTYLTRALRGQGYVLIETGKLDEARALYEQCLKLDPDDRGAQKELNYIAGLLRNKQ